MDVYARPDCKHPPLFRAHTDLCAMVAWGPTAEAARNILLADLKRLGFDVSAMKVTEILAEGQLGTTLWTYRRPNEH